MIMKINKTIGFFVMIFIALNPTFAQTTKDLLNLVVQDIASGECKIELQRNMKPLCIGFDTDNVYSKDLQDIAFNPFKGIWDSSQFDNVSNSNDYNILIARQDSNCCDNAQIWHCQLSSISYNSDSTLALIQYYKFIFQTDKNESGTVMYKVRNGVWVQHFVVESLIKKNSITD
jgi:hypothetical protein